MFVLIALGDLVLLATVLLSVYSVKGRGRFQIGIAEATILAYIATTIALIGALGAQTPPFRIWGVVSFAICFVTAVVGVIMTSRARRANAVAASPQTPADE